MRAMAIFAFLIGCGTAPVRAQAAVALGAATAHKFYRESTDNEIYLEARIAVGRDAEAAAAQRNVALVLDRSGSMAGEPIMALRAAAAAVIGAMADGDIVAVVAFGSEVETIIEAQRRDQAGEVAARLAAIQPAGGSALFDALNQAAAQVRRHAGPATINRIILVTDGPPTKGPREAADFARLAEVFAGEGTMLSTIGFGPDCEEDTLAAMARSGHGRFRHVAEPGGLASALRAEFAPEAAVAGSDAVLTIEFARIARKARSHGWRAPAVDGRALTWRFPRLVAGETLGVLASAEIGSFHARFEQPAFATVTLRWKNAADGKARELVRIVPVVFSADAAEVRESTDAAVVRAGASVTIREGLQRAIEALDKGEPRRALRVLRSARNEARDLNFDLDDAGIAEMVRRLDGFLGQAQGRTLGAADRKIFRAGLLGEFDPPAPSVDPKD